MITVANLTFSITMLTLQLASSQFGPRLLRDFMRDRGNQVMLGGHDRIACFSKIYRLRATAGRSRAAGFQCAVDDPATVRRLCAVGRQRCLATEEDLIVSVTARPGTFVTERGPLLRVVAPTGLAEEKVDALRATLIIGMERTLYQDLEFSLRRIVGIAQRDLSPGLNDPTIALRCIDRLREASVRLAGRDIPSSWRHDEDGCLRIAAVPAPLRGPDRCRIYRGGTLCGNGYRRAERPGDGARPGDRRSRIARSFGPPRAASVRSWAFP